MYSIGKIVCTENGKKKQFLRQDHMLNTIEIQPYNLHKYLLYISHCVTLSSFIPNFLEYAK